MMISNALAFVCATMPLVSGLVLLQDPASPTRPGGNAYVVMWITKGNVPEGIKLSQSTMTEDEEKSEIRSMEQEGYTSVSKRANLHQTVVEESDAVENDSEWTTAGGKHALAIADRLRAVGSKYPLVILTNTPALLALKHNATLKAQYPNVVIREIAEHEWLKHECKMAAGHLLHFQKLFIFGLTEWDKLIWMDVDVKLKKNADSVFDTYDVKNGQQVWGQRDNWSCDSDTHKFCSGMMLFKPTKDHVQGLVQQARSMGSCWGDQTLIAKYFSKGAQGRSKAIFPKSVVNWGHCNAGHSMASHNQMDR